MHPFRRRLILAFVFASAALFMATASAQPDKRSYGTWKLNVTKSKYTPGPAPQSLIVKWEPAGKGGVWLTSEGIGPDGNPFKGTYTANYDGKDYPYVGSPAFDTISLRRIDANTVERTDKKAGKVVQVLTRVMAKDGKTFTVTSKGMTAKGEPIHNVSVFEKQ
jgi:hypothetical protein